MYRTLLRSAMVVVAAAAALTGCSTSKSAENGLAEEAIVSTTGSVASRIARAMSLPESGLVSSTEKCSQRRAQAPEQNFRASRDYLEAVPAEKGAAAMDALRRMLSPGGELAAQFSDETWNPTLETKREIRADVEVDGLQLHISASLSSVDQRVPRRLAVGELYLSVESTC